MALHIAREVCFVALVSMTGALKLELQQQQQQHSLFSQASWGRLEMKPERNKFYSKMRHKYDHMNYF